MPRRTRGQVQRALMVMRERATPLKMKVLFVTFTLTVRTRQIIKTKKHFSVYQTGEY